MLMELSSLKTTGPEYVCVGGGRQAGELGIETTKETLPLAHNS